MELWRQALEVGETPEHCLARELREEFGIEVVVEGILHAQRLPLMGRRIDCSILRCSGQSSLTSYTFTETRALGSGTATVEQNP